MWLASPVTALVAGGLVAALFAIGVLLTILTRDLRVTADGFVPATLLTLAAVGMVIARRQPRNAIGWLLLSVAVVAMFDEVAKLYLVLDYRIHHGTLLFGRLVVYWAAPYTLLPFLIALPVILLFPDGRAPSSRWRQLLLAYVALAALFMAAQYAGEAQVIGRPVSLLVSGEPNSPQATGLLGTAQNADWWVSAPLFIIFWASFVGHQVVSWRNSSAERRQQLKWLMSGGAICVISCLLIVVSGNNASLTANVVLDASALGVAALPVSIGVGILKFRLYEVDRLISRTLSYAILTATLVSVFVGIVTLATRVLPFSSPVAVATSTLAAAALFNPLRLRVQRIVDHRFNRARYDAATTVAAFNAQLRNAVDLDTVRNELMHAVHRSLQPTHATLWIRPPTTRPHT